MCSGTRRCRHDPAPVAPVRLVVDPLERRRSDVSGLGLMDGPELDTFNRLCQVAKLRTKGPGITLDQLGDAAALARELQKNEPDAERVELFAARLGLEPTEVDP